MRQAVVALPLLLAAALARAEETSPKNAEAPAAERPKAEAPAVKVMSEKELVDDDGYVVRLSLATEEEIAQWAQPGFRLDLGFVSGSFGKRGPAPKLETKGALLRARARLDRFWSLGVSFEYDAVRGDFGGLRFGGT